jgi:hypothetical protein
MEIDVKQIDRKTLEKIASKITVKLFREGGTLRKADRLVLEFDGGKITGTGWSDFAVRDVILDELLKLID